MKNIILCLFVVIFSATASAGNFVEFMQTAPVKLVAEIRLQRDLEVSSSLTLRAQPISLQMNYHELLITSAKGIEVRSGLFRIQVEGIHYDYKSGNFIVQSTFLGSRRMGYVVGADDEIAACIKELLGPGIRNFFRNVRNISGLRSLGEMNKIVESFLALFPQSTGDYPAMTGSVYLHVTPSKSEEVSIPGASVSMIAGQGFRLGGTFRLSGQNFFITGLRLSSFVHPAYPLNIHKGDLNFQISSVLLSEENGLEITGTNNYDQKLQAGLALAETLAKLAARDPSAGIRSDIPQLNLIEQLAGDALGDVARDFIYSYRPTLLSAGLSAQLIGRVEKQFEADIVVTGHR